MHRIAFEMGPFVVTWYGLFVASGFWLGAWTAARRAPKAGLSPNVVWDLLWVLIVAGIIGARALYVVTYWRRDFHNQPWSEIFMVQHGGLVFHGGFVAATLAGLAWSTWKRLPTWTLADVLAPGIALGHAVGRIGCFINGCCYGRVCDLPWAVRYPAVHESHGVPIHPTQIYEAVLSGLLALGLAWGFSRRRFEGQIFALYLVGYGSARGFVECFRGDYPPDAMVGSWITPAHWISAAMIVLGLLLYQSRRRHPRLVPGLPATHPT